MQGVRGETREADQQLLRAVDWMRQRGENIDAQIWEGIWQIAQKAKRHSVRLKAFQVFASRVDPEPRSGDDNRAPVSISVAIVTTDRAGLPSQGNGVAVRIGRGNGDSA